MLTGCVNEDLKEYSSASSKKITFQTAKYLTTRSDEQINGSKFTYDHFVTCAWSDAVVADGKVFMNHQKVVKDETGNVWMPIQTYYWPNYSTVDFISYYPEQTGTEKNWPKVEEGKLTYTEYDVSGEKADIGTDTNDLMYADKAVGYGANVDRVNDNNDGTDDSGYEGVPTLFRHALAQLEIRVLVQQPDGETESHWEAVIEHAALTGYYTKGDLTLTLNNPELTHGVTGWTPEDESNKAGWKLSADAATTESPIADKDNTDDNITVESTGTGDDYSETGCKTLFKAFVLPQELTDKHFFDLKFTLDKYRGETKETSEADTEIRHIQLKTDNITYWGMNQRIVYTIVINPAKNGRILLDPAIADWEDVNPEKNADDVMKYYIEIPGEDDWTASNVWHAYNENGDMVAEMSKELIGVGLDTYYQAVVVNPVVNGETDLKNGFIAQVLQSADGSSFDDHAGGSVSYLTGYDISNVGTTKLGNAKNYDYCMVENGKIVGIRETDGMLKYTNKKYTVFDYDTNEYPVVRIGVFYWLSENLRATHYSNGTEIADAGDDNVTVNYYKTATDQETKNGIRIFHDKAAYKAPESGLQADIKKYGLLYNFRAVSGANEDGYYYYYTPTLDSWNENNGGETALVQKGTPNVEDEKSNPTICPDGWYIPHVFYQPWIICTEVDYLDSYFVWVQWQYYMSAEQLTSLQNLPELNGYNLSGFSLNLYPGYDQDGTFGLATDYKENPTTYCVPFWTANLVMYDNELLYPTPGTFYNGGDGISWYSYTNTYMNKDALEKLGKAYYPVRCVRIEKNY